MHVIGKDNPGVDAEGCASARPANGVVQFINLLHQQIRTTVKQVHGEEVGHAWNAGAPVVRHGGNMPELLKRRKRSAFPPYACSTRHCIGLGRRGWLFKLKS